MEQMAANESHVKPSAETTEVPVTVRVVVEREARDKKGTSSRGSRRLGEIDQRAVKAVRRMTRALDRGVDTYIEQRDKSKEKRKDGVVVDFVENVAHGVSRAMAEVSPIVHDVAEAMNTRKVRTQVRRVARTFGNIPFIG